MPKSMSIGLFRLRTGYGAAADLTPKEKGMKGAIARAQELAAQTPDSWIPQQFENPANVAVHEATTAQKFCVFPEGLDAAITGVGTGGHLSGVAKVLKAKWPNLKVYAVEPSASCDLWWPTSTSPHTGHWRGLYPQNLNPPTCWTA